MDGWAEGRNVGILKEGGDRSRWVDGGSGSRHTRKGLVNREGKNRC